MDAPQKSLKELNIKNRKSLYVYSEKFQTTTVILNKFFTKSFFSFQALRKMGWSVWKASSEYLYRIYLTNLIFIYFHRIISVCVLQKLEERGASDQELKLTELLRYYTRDIQAAKVTPSCLFQLCKTTLVTYIGMYNSTKCIKLYVL